MLFKDKLKQLRLNNKLTQEDLAKVLGYTRAAISGYELGRNEPDYEVLNKIAKYFDVTTDYLIDNNLKEYLKKQKEQPNNDYIKVAQKAEKYGIPAKTLDEFIDLIKKSVVKE